MAIPLHCVGSTEQKHTAKEIPLQLNAGVGGEILPDRPAQIATNHIPRPDRQHGHHQPAHGLAQAKIPAIDLSSQPQPGRELPLKPPLPILHSLHRFKRGKFKGFERFKGKIGWFKV